MTSMFIHIIQPPVVVTSSMWKPLRRRDDNILASCRYIYKCFCEANISKLLTLDDQTVLFLTHRLCRYKMKSTLDKTHIYSFPVSCETKEQHHQTHSMYSTPTDSSNYDDLTKSFLYLYQAALVRSLKTSERIAQLGSKLNFAPAPHFYIFSVMYSVM